MICIIYLWMKVDASRVVEGVLVADGGLVVVVVLLLM